MPFQAGEHPGYLEHTPEGTLICQARDLSGSMQSFLVECKT